MSLLLELDHDLMEYEISIHLQQQANNRSWLGLMLRIPSTYCSSICPGCGSGFEAVLAGSIYLHNPFHPFHVKEKAIDLVWVLGNVIRTAESDLERCRKFAFIVHEEERDRSVLINDRVCVGVCVCLHGIVWHASWSCVIYDSVKVRFPLQSYLLLFSW